MVRDLSTLYSLDVHQGPSLRSGCVHDTCEHHDVLEVGADLVLATQVDEEGQRVDVRCPAQEHSHLCDDRVKSRGTATQHTLNQARFPELSGLSFSC